MGIFGLFRKKKEENAKEVSTVKLGVSVIPEEKRSQQPRIPQDRDQIPDPQGQDHRQTGLYDAL